MMYKNITSNRDYATENINLRQQIIDLEVANKDKAERIKSMNKELLEYSELRKRFKILYEENQKYKQLQDELGCPLDVVFKALKEGVSYNREDVARTHNVKEWLDFATRPRLYYSDDFECWCFELFLGGYVLRLEDYGKTWWLKGERSE